MTHDRFIIATGLGSLALAALLAGCATSQPWLYSPPPLGSTWVTAQQNTGSFGSGARELPGVRGERTWQGKQYVTFRSPEQEILADRSGAFHAFVRGDTLLVSFDPPSNWDYPLEVGKSWKRSVTMTNHVTKQKVTYEQSVKVEAYEDLNTRAGTFKAFRVKSSDTLGSDNTQWIAPDLGIFVKQSLVRTAKHPAGPGTRETEIISQTIKK
jgi:hypothetical protein